MTTSSLSTILHLLSAHARLEERFSGELGAVHGLALKEVLLLMHLARATAHRLSRVDLAKRLSISASTVTRMAMPLEKLGLIGREADARDARLAYVVLTPSGHEVLNNATTTLEKQSASIFRDRWSDADITALGALLGRLSNGQPGDLS